MKEKLTILVVEPDKPAYPKTINNTLESLQAEVGGYIQPLYAFEDPVAILCNDEIVFHTNRLNHSSKQINYADINCKTKNIIKTSPKIEQTTDSNKH